MSLKGRARAATRHRKTSDEARPRQLAVAGIGAVIALAIAVVAVPRGSLTTPGPLSASHVRAGVKCASCHDADASTRTSTGASGRTSTSTSAIVGSDACRGCHGEHALRGGHAKAAERGVMTCATCHPAHGAEAVRFIGEGRAIHSTPSGRTEVAAAPIPSGVTVPIMRTAICKQCHEPSRPSDPLRACVDASGSSSPPLVVRCLGEHDRGFVSSGRVACAAQHDDARFAAREAALRVAGGTSVASASGGALAPWLGLAPIALGLLAYAGARAKTRRRKDGSRGGEAAVAPPPVRKLPVIDASRCLGCYACVDACAFDVLSVERYVAVVARPDACCGALSCEAACPNGSLVLRDEGAAPPGPRLTSALESEIAPGVFFAGDVTGVPLIRNAVLHGRRTVDAVFDRRKTRPRRPGEDADVIILGAGPAGLAASLRAEERGLSYVTLEQHAVAASIKSFPRGKLVFDAPFELPLEGEIFVRECTKEELVGQWMRIVRTRKPRVLERHRVVEVARDGEGPGASLVVTYARADESRGTLRAGAIIVAIGQRGTPRRLTATVDEGADDMIADALYDAHSFAGKRVLVVGLGDSAMEAAQALAHQPGTEIIVVHRGSGFARGRERNVAETKALAEAGRIAIRFETHVAHVARGKVILERAGSREELEVDAVLALIGGTPSMAVLEGLGFSDRSIPEQPRLPVS